MKIRTEFVSNSSKKYQISCNIALIGSKLK